MSSVVISGDTSGAITLSAPAVSGTTTLTLPATTGTVLNDATVGVCRAWVNFNGTGTVAIRASFNVTSITDGGVGVYTINFTTAISDTNYCVVMTGGLNNTNAIIPTVPINDVPPTTSACRINTVTSNGVVADAAVVYCSIFR